MATASTPTTIHSRGLLAPIAVPFELRPDVSSGRIRFVEPHRDAAGVFRVTALAIGLVCLAVTPALFFLNWANATDAIVVPILCVILWAAFLWHAFSAYVRARQERRLEIDAGIGLVRLSLYRRGDLIRQDESPLDKATVFIHPVNYKPRRGIPWKGFAVILHAGHAPGDDVHASNAHIFTLACAESEAQARAYAAELPEALHARLGGAGPELQNAVHARLQAPRLWRSTPGQRPR